MDSIATGMSFSYVTGRPIRTEFMDKGMASGDQVNGHGLPLISLGTIKTVTNNFSGENLLGRGGFGRLQGLLPNGNKVAVKRLARTFGQGLEEFQG
ncbi:putative receptor-like protein kinase isoform X1 [Cinnamomum micranthum f. kanehirae]|uniref:Putative receptor-like protein kinase isoform X1 n=1 Tax=Cinnamomum micranthum f. kanehirae TaxID=337451 RepID=A0A3S3NIK7_9MAGN|nr:putative receptor-like protein kinase isoform X1 [Cinnamomum micranthum f. kanehirae]